MKPKAIGIGAQKCMTSWLHAVADAHPQVAASRPKELDFFSHRFDRGYRWYESHWPERGARVGYECSPSYLPDPRAPARAAAFAPGLRLVALLRDPVERAYSNHLHEIARGHLPPCTFAEGLAQNPAYVEQGLYATHMGRWLDRFPAESCLVLTCEEVAEDAAAAARAFYAFLGVDPSFRPAMLGERRNESDRPRSEAARRLLRAAGAALRRGGLEPALVRLKRLRPIEAALRCNSRPLRAEIPPMAPADAARLRDLFAPEVARLATMLGRDSLPWPTWQAAARVPGARLDLAG